MNCNNDSWLLRLYVAGMTPSAQRALTQITTICQAHLKGHYNIEVIDLLDNPSLAEEHQIFAVPTLERALPTPFRKLVGDLTDTQRVLVGLDLHPQSGAA